MYACDQDRSATRAASNASCQPFGAAGSLHHRSALAPGQAPAASSPAAAQPRRDRKRHATALAQAQAQARAPTSATSRRRSSTTVVATDVSNFRAMVQELTGFPAAAIFRPLPRRVHATSPFAGAHGGGGGAISGHSSSDAATTGGSDHSPAGVPTVQAQPLTQQPQCPPPVVFDGLSDIASPEFDSWTDLSFE